MRRNPDPNADPVSEFDLDAYVDGQLDEPRRAKVEDFLSRDPEAAAQVMRDLRIRRDLRSALAPVGAPSAEARKAAIRLERGFAQDAVMRRLLRLAPVASLIAVGWLAHAGFGPLSAPPGAAAVEPPPFVAAAVSAREASVLRLPMRSQPQATLDPEEMRAATGVLLPRFAPDWILRDAQIFPSPQGPGIEIVFDSAEFGRVTHFAVRPGVFAVALPKGERRGEGSAVWFQIGETAHVLIAETPEVEKLTAAAEALSATLY